jgi:hypothetical protein
MTTFDRSRSVSMIVSLAGVAAAGLLVAGVASAKSDPAPALPPMKAGVNVKCLEANVKSDKPVAGAWITLGMLDQVRGDLKAAEEKYRKGYSAGATDLAAAKIDFTLVGGAIWIQDAGCPVPVPAAGADAKETTDLKGPKAPAYPTSLMGFKAEGNATIDAVIGPDGQALRVTVKEASAGPTNVERHREPGEEDAERLVSRVQFALVAMQATRDFKFPDGGAGKIYEAKMLFQPPHDISQDLPGSGSMDTTRGDAGGVKVGGKK